MPFPECCLSITITNNRVHFLPHFFTDIFFCTENIFLLSDLSELLAHLILQFYSQDFSRLFEAACFIRLLKNAH